MSELLIDTVLYQPDAVRRKLHHALSENYWVFHVSYMMLGEYFPFGGTFICYGETEAHAREHLYRNATFLGYLTDVTRADFHPSIPLSWQRPLAEEIYTLMTTTENDIAHRILAKDSVLVNFTAAIDEIEEKQRYRPLIMVSKLTQLLPQ